MDTKKDFLRTLSALVVAILLSCILIQILTSVVIDPYLHATNRYVNLIDFYANNKEENKIYFIGNSFIEWGVNASEVERAMNYSYKAYNLGISSDKKDRLVELDNLIKSKPKVVVYGISYNSFTNDSKALYPNLERRFGFVTDKVKLDSYSQQLFNSAELGLIKRDYLHLLAYKRPLLVPSIQMALTNRWHIKNVFHIQLLRPKNFQFKGSDFPKLIICRKTKKQFKNHIYKSFSADNTIKKHFGIQLNA